MCGIDFWWLKDARWRFCCWFLRVHSELLSFIWIANFVFLLFLCLFKILLVSGTLVLMTWYLCLYVQYLARKFSGFLFWLLLLFFPCVAMILLGNDTLILVVNFSGMWSYLFMYCCWFILGTFGEWVLVTKVIWLEG